MSTLVRFAPVALLLCASCSGPLLIGDLPDCTGLWVDKIGDGNTDHAYLPMSHAVDKAGNILITGRFTGTLDLGGAPLAGPSAGEDTFVAKIAGDGAPVWSKRLGNTGRETGVAVDGAGNVILTGTLDGTLDFEGASLSSSQAGDPFLAKLDPQGNYLWGTVFEWTGFGNDLFGAHTLSAAVDDAGFLVLSGDLDGNLDLGGAQVSATHGAYLARLDPSGATLWSKTFNDASLRAVTNSAGDIGVAGKFLDTLDLGGASQPLESFSLSEPQPFIARLDKAGTARHAKRIGTTPTSYGNYFGSQFALAADGSIVITGDNNTHNDLRMGTIIVAPFQSYLFKLDPAGELVWGKLGSGSMASEGVVTDAQGNVFAFGLFNNGLFSGSSASFGDCVSSGHSSTFVMGVGPTGNLLSCRELGYARDDRPGDTFRVNQLSPDGDGKLVLGGEFTGHLSLACANLTATATADTLTRGNEILAKIAP